MKSGLPLFFNIEDLEYPMTVFKKPVLIDKNDAEAGRRIAVAKDITAKVTLIEPRPVSKTDIASRINMVAGSTTAYFLFDAKVNSLVPVEDRLVHSANEMKHERKGDEGLIDTFHKKVIGELLSSRIPVEERKSLVMVAMFGRFESQEGFIHLTPLSGSSENNAALGRSCLQALQSEYKLNPSKQVQAHSNIKLK